MNQVIFWHYCWNENQHKNCTGKYHGFIGNAAAHAALDKREPTEFVNAPLNSQCWHSQVPSVVVRRQTSIYRSL